MNRLFNTVKTRMVKRNKFDLSHEKKLSVNMGNLYPIYLQEILPGDKFKVNTEMLIRFHPLIAPLMHRIDAYVHYFFVPNRLVFKNWGDFITGGKDGLDATPFPTIGYNEFNTTYFGQRSLADYLGLPTLPQGPVTAPLNISALPFRAYQLIYNEYYRDQTLTTEVPITDDDTVTTQELMELVKLRKRAWAKDYFTSALPWTQRGGEVGLPIEADYSPYSTVIDPNTGLPNPAGGSLSVAIDGTLQVDSTPGTLGQLQNLDTQMTSVTINELRKSIRLQEWLEKNARAGSRYVEQLAAHFGVTSDDLRHMRPQYLGGGKTPITVSEVLANFGSTEMPLGTMAGHGLGVGNTNSFRKFFNEHGHVMGILSIIPKASYQDGMPRMFLKETKFDFAFPEFANLGEQPVYTDEVLYLPTDAQHKQTWGYQSRYAEYKFQPNTVHGDFKENLSFWHAGRQFTTRPSLNGVFVTCDTSTIDDRIFPVADGQDTDKIYIQLYNNVKALRPLPVYGTPIL